MKTIISHLFLYLLLPLYSEGYKILGIFPYNGRSHHIIFSSLVEELANRNHDVTVINYFPVKKMPNLRQISLQGDTGEYDNVTMKETLKDIPNSIFVDFYRAYDMAVAFKSMANDNCKRLMTNEDTKKLISSGGKYDLVISEQFVTDCGLAIAYKLNAPVVGITAHMLMPWTYSRLGAPNNPAFVPNHLIATGTKPSLWQKIKSTIINFSMNAYHRHAIQKGDQDIVDSVYPEVPDLESLGNNISLILLNQYFPLTGSRLQGANVIEVGGMHIKGDYKITNAELQYFLDTAENGVVYISFGSVANDFPIEILNEITAFVQKTKMNFIWKVDNITEAAPKNLLMGKWLPQLAILCHPKVVAFVTHTGMLSTTEAVHCGVPLIAVPLFGDQFSNAAAVLENGLGVVVDIYTIDRNILGEALRAVLQESYQRRVKQFSNMWRERPKSAMDTAVFWIEYVIRHQGLLNMKPPSMYLSTWEYLILDVLLVLGISFTVTIFLVVILLRIIVRHFINRPVNKKQKKKNA